MYYWTNSTMFTLANALTSRETRCDEVGCPCHLHVLCTQQRYMKWRTHRSQIHCSLTSMWLCFPLSGLRRPLLIQVSGLNQNAVPYDLWPSALVFPTELCLRLQRHWRASLHLPGATTLSAFPGSLWLNWRLQQRPFISITEANLIQNIGKPCYTPDWLVTWDQTT